MHVCVCAWQMVAHICLIALAAKGLISPDKKNIVQANVCKSTLLSHLPHTRHSVLYLTIRLCLNWLKILGNLTCEIIHNLYSEAKSSVETSKQRSSFFQSNIGVRQGENLSPLLFAIFLNPFAAKAIKHICATICHAHTHTHLHARTQPHTHMPFFIL